MKVDLPQVTKYSNDKGVDFYGQLKLDQHLFIDQRLPYWHRQLKGWLVGQAKHYVDGAVSTPALRDLIGTVTILKGPLADRRAYPSLVIRTCDPVFMMLVTTGRLSRDVWDELERTGAIGIDGEMLASFLASQAVGYRDEAFDEIAFSEWISTFQAAPDPSSEDDD